MNVNLYFFVVSALGYLYLIYSIESLVLSGILSLTYLSLGWAFSFEGKK